jgi:hypothetical protein
MNRRSFLQTSVGSLLAGGALAALAEGQTKPKATPPKRKRPATHAGRPAAKAAARRRRVARSLARRRRKRLRIRHWWYWFRRL